MPSAPSRRLIHARRGPLITMMDRQLQRKPSDDACSTVSDCSIEATVSMSSIDYTEELEQLPAVTAIPLSSEAATPGSGLSSLHQSPENSSTTPSSNMNHIPIPPPVYLESQILMDSILAVSCITLYSYLLAYDRLYGGTQSNIPFYHYLPTPRNTFLSTLLLGRRTGLVSAEEFMQYGISFPSVMSSADSNASLPPRFQYPVLRYPRLERLPVVYPINAPSIMHERNDWNMQVQRFLDHYRPHVYEPTPVPPELYYPRQLADERFSHPRPTPVFPARRPKQYSRNSRTIKPLPKRAQAVPQTSQTTVLGFVAQTVVDVGSVIVKGVKRVKDGLEEGGILKKRRLL